MSAPSKRVVRDAVRLLADMQIGARFLSGSCVALQLPMYGDAANLARAAIFSTAAGVGAFRLDDVAAAAESLLLQGWRP